VDKVVPDEGTGGSQTCPYLLAVALLDGDVMPAQFKPDRIINPDVQGLAEEGIGGGRTTTTPISIRRKIAGKKLLSELADGEGDQP